MVVIVARGRWTLVIDSLLLIRKCFVKCVCVVSDHDYLPNSIVFRSRLFTDQACLAINVVSDHVSI